MLRTLKGGDWIFLTRHEGPDKGTEDYDKNVVSDVLAVLKIKG